MDIALIILLPLISILFIIVLYFMIFGSKKKQAYIRGGYRNTQRSNEYVKKNYESDEDDVNNIIDSVLENNYKSNEDDDDEDVNNVDRNNRKNDASVLLGYDDDYNDSYKPNNNYDEEEKKSGSIFDDFGPMR